VIRLMMYIRKPFVERVAFNKKNILRRDHYTCQYCRPPRDRLTIDHVVPRSRGGGTTWTNVVAACLRCNPYKGNRTADEAGMALVRAPAHPQFLFSVHLLRHPHASFFLDAGGSTSTRFRQPSPRAPERPSARAYTVRTGCLRSGSSPTTRQGRPAARHRAAR
jgi:hypothetical protein